MSYFKTTICGRCGKPMETAFYDACHYCQQRDGVNVNYTTMYDLSEAKLPPKGKAEGIYRFRVFFALGDAATEVSIGEGNTPQVVSNETRKAEIGCWPHNELSFCMTARALYKRPIAKCTYCEGGLLCYV